MDLGLSGQRVIVTAGAGGIGLEIARGFVAEGARVAVCDIDRAALDRLAASDPGIFAAACDVADRDAGGRVLRRGDRLAGRARHPGQQRRHRRTHRPGRGYRPRGLGPLPDHLSDQPVQLRPAGGAAAAPVGQSVDRQPVVAGRPDGICPAQSLCGGEMGGDRLHPIAVDRTRPRPHPRQRRAARSRRRRPPAAGAGGQGAAAGRRASPRSRTRAFSATSIRDYVTPGQIADQILFVASPRGRTISGQALSVCGDTQMLT